MKLANEAAELILNEAAELILNEAAEFTELVINEAAEILALLVYHSLLSNRKSLDKLQTYLRK